MDRPRVWNGKPQEQQIVVTALQRIRRLASGNLLALGLNPLCRRILDHLDGKFGLSVRCKDCRDGSPRAFVADWEAGEIHLCRSALSLGERSIAAILFRELVRLCGGARLDSEALQQHCFPGVSPAPTPELIGQFRECPVIEGLHAGRFVLWNPETGELFVRQGSGKQAVPGPRLGAAFALARPKPQPVTEPNRMETPTPATPLPGNLQVPLEVKELVQEILYLGPWTPEEWNEVMARMTRYLSAKREGGEAHGGPA